jgi:hypothetical protein
MATTRLKKDHKVEIHDSCLRAAAKDRLEILEQQENKVARALYLHLIKGYGKHLQAVPSGFIQNCGKIDVRLYKNQTSLDQQKNATAFKRTDLAIVYQQDYLQVDSGYAHGTPLLLGEEVRMPHNLVCGKARILANSDIGLEIQALIFEEEKLFNDLTKLSETVLAALASCTTVKKLIENYPELKPYAPSDIANTALAVAHGKINDLIQCTKKSTCDEDKPKKRGSRNRVKPVVIALK